MNGPRLSCSTFEYGAVLESSSAAVHFWLAAAEDSRGPFIGSNSPIPLF